MENVLPGSFKMNVEEMYRINKLPKVNFPNYIPPANIETSGIKEELQKLKQSFDRARRAEENVPQREPETERQTEEEKKQKTWR